MAPIKEFYRKITERVKVRFKKKSKFNWPELDMYCGCCSLTTGIYIRSAINLAMTTMTILWNAKILSHMLDVSTSVFGTNPAANESDFRIWVPERNLTKLYLIYNCLVTYYILWLCYKVIYVLILLWTIFAIFKRNAKMMKILLFISLPNWILDILISFLSALIIRYSMRIVLIVGILFEGYNILALNSEYKKIIGKSKVRHKDIESDPETPSPPPPFINLSHRDLRYGYDQIHCRGCNCTINEPPDNGNGVVSNQPSADPIQTTQRGNKEINENELNYAMTGILNPRNTEESVSSEVGSTSGQQAVRPNTLDLTLNMVKDEKVVITDEPVIYDVRQLNVGTSPVFEDREREA